jgi:hypothetical protein
MLMSEWASLNHAVSIPASRTAFTNASNVWLPGLTSKCSQDDQRGPDGRSGGRKRESLDERIKIMNTVAIPRVKPIRGLRPSSPVNVGVKPIPHLPGSPIEYGCQQVWED